MLNSQDVERLSEKVLKLLAEVGILVENGEVVEACLAKGCAAGPGGRLRIPPELIEELVSFQKPAQEEYERDHELVYTCGPDWTHYLTWRGQAEAFREAHAQRFLMQAFDCGPTTY